MGSVSHNGIEEHNISNTEEDGGGVMKSHVAYMIF